MTAASTCRSHRSKNLNRARPTTPVASSAAIVAALDATTGEPIWKTYTIAEDAESRRQELARQRHARPRGRRRLGDADSRRQTPRAVLRHGQRVLRRAQDGQRHHGRQHGHGQSAVDDAGDAARCVAQRLPADDSGRAIQPAGTRARGTAGGAGRGGHLRMPAAARGRRSRRHRPWARGAGPRGGGTPYPPENCPSPPGPDWDFSASSSLATTTDGRDIIIAPQKQGLVWALNPATGAVLWKQDVAREIAGWARRDAVRRRRRSREGVLRSDQRRASRARSQDRRGSLVLADSTRRTDARASAASSAPSR